MTIKEFDLTPFKEPQPEKIYISFDLGEVGYDILMQLKSERVNIKKLVESMLKTATDFKEEKPSNGG